MESINYIKGDATKLLSPGNKIIVHICNDIGGWGRGFVLALSARWREPEHEYRRWFQSNQNFALGEVLLVQVEQDTWVANIIGQKNTKNDKDGQKIGKNNSHENKHYSRSIIRSSYR